jgi:uncharacterized protein YeaO (DUF488 family)
MIRTKPASQPKHRDDGYRILIEPHWPRGLPKGKAGGVDWMRSLYPGPGLRDWMSRNPRKGAAFRDKYMIELSHKEAEIAKVCQMHRERGTVTILTVPDSGPWDIHDTLVKYLNAMCD